MYRALNSLYASFAASVPSDPGFIAYTPPAPTASDAFVRDTDNRFRAYVDGHIAVPLSLRRVSGGATDTDVHQRARTPGGTLASEAMHMLPCSASSSAKVYKHREHEDRHVPCFSFVRRAYAELACEDKPPSTGRADELYSCLSLELDQHWIQRASRLLEDGTKHLPSRAPESILCCPGMAVLAGAAGVPALKWLLRGVNATTTRSLWWWGCVLLGAVEANNTRFTQHAIDDLVARVDHSPGDVPGVSAVLGAVALAIAENGTAEMARVFADAVARTPDLRYQRVLTSRIKECMRVVEANPDTGTTGVFVDILVALRIGLVWAAKDAVNAANDRTYGVLVKRVEKEGLTLLLFACVEARAARCLQDTLDVMDTKYGMLPITDEGVVLALVDRVARGVRLAVDDARRERIRSILVLLRERGVVSSTRVAKYIIKEEPAAIGTVLPCVENPTDLLFFTCTELVCRVHATDLLDAELASVPEDCVSHDLSPALFTAIEGRSACQSLSTAVAEIVDGCDLDKSLVYDWTRENRARLRISAKMTRLLYEKLGGHRM